MAAWIGGEFGGRMDTCICMAESLCSPHETITTLLINCSPIENKIFKKQTKNKRRKKKKQANKKLNEIHCVQMVSLQEGMSLWFVCVGTRAHIEGGLKYPGM